jgi:hypothetical protein
MILFEKFGQHQPLNRQADRYGREGVPLSLSTLADQVGAGCTALAPLLQRLEKHVFAAERLHGDDTTVPVLGCWLREQRAKLSRGNDLARAIDYMLKRWTSFTRFLDVSDATAAP